MNEPAALADVRYLLENGQTLDAARMLSRAANEANPDALYELASWAISGDIIPRDLRLVYALLGRAKDADHAEAALLHAYFTAAGTGCLADWEQALAFIKELAKTSAIAERQVQLLDSMPLNKTGAPPARPKLTSHSSQPKIAVCRGLLTQAECQYVVDIGSPFLTPSHVFDPQTRQLIPHPVRKSQGAMFGVYTEDLVINAINRRIAAMSGTTYDQGEPLQLLQYRRGDEYRPHLDALPGEKNQRVLTAIVYLTDDYTGGETEFLRTGFSFKGEKGDALLFANVLPDGQPDALSLHCGKPVQSGTKSIASRWIRRSRFTYPDPPSMLTQLPSHDG